MSSSVSLLQVCAAVSARSSSCTPCSLHAKPSLRRLQSKLWKQDRLQGFLQEHHFADACEPSPSRACCTSWIGGETLHPIHVAARLGNPQILRLSFVTSALCRGACSRAGKAGGGGWVCGYVSGVGGWVCGWVGE